MKIFLQIGLDRRITNEPGRANQPTGAPSNHASRHERLDCFVAALLAMMREDDSTPPSLREERSNPFFNLRTSSGLLRRCAPRNDGEDDSTPPSLRAERSNPFLTSAQALDCFVAALLAMTGKDDFTPPSLRAERSNPLFNQRTSSGLLRRCTPRNDGEE